MEFNKLFQTQNLVNY